MPFVGNDKLEEFKQAVAERDALQTEVGLYQRAGAIAARAKEILDEYEVQYIPEEADRLAEVALVNELQGEALDARVKDVKDETREAVRSRLISDHSILATARLQLEESGELEAIEGEELSKAQEVAADEARTIFRKETQDALATSEIKVELVAAALQTLRNSTEGEELATSLRHAAEEECRNEATVILSAEVTAELEAQKDKRVAALKESLRAEPNLGLKNHRLAEESRLGEHYEQIALEELMLEITDEVGKAKIQERLDQIAETNAQFDTDAKRKAILEEFTGKGIDTTKIEEGLELVIDLGDFEPRRHISGDGYGNNKKVYGPVCIADREIILISLGDGKFRVKSDTLAPNSLKGLTDFAAQTLRKTLLESGTVILIGSSVKENSGHTFQQLLMADARFCYDVDTTNDDFVETVGNVAKARIGGFEARKTDKALWREK